MTPVAPLGTRVSDHRQQAIPRGRGDDGQRCCTRPAQGGDGRELPSIVMSLLDPLLRARPQMRGDDACEEAHTRVRIADPRIAINWDGIPMRRNAPR